MLCDVHQTVVLNGSAYVRLVVARTACLVDREFNPTLLNEAMGLQGGAAQTLIMQVSLRCYNNC